MTTASIITIGDEILIGQILDTNSRDIAIALGERGIRVTGMQSVGDERNILISTLKQALYEHDIVIVTGGLGPTKDDITKTVLAELSGSKCYVTNKEQEAIVYKILRSRGLDVLDCNKLQACVPDTCEVIPNRFGTAPIMVFSFEPSIYGHPAVLYSMPGVPFETTNMLPDVLDDISTRFSLSKIIHRNIMTYGIAESALSKKIEAWEDNLPDDIHLAYLPSTLRGVRLRLSIYGADSEKDESRLEGQINALEALIGDYIYSHIDSSLEAAIGEILKAHGCTLSAAESCTGGEISHLLTTVPGSSAYYLGSVTSYAVSVKELVLGVPSETILNNGIVSSEVAAAMARGVKRVTGSDFSVATTGFAGPGGGDEREPEGTVWVGVCVPDGQTFTKRFEYHNDRKRNIERFAASALHFLFKIVKSYLNV